MFHTVESNHFPGLFEAMPLYAPAGPYGHAPRQANPVLTQGHRGAQGRVSPPTKVHSVINTVLTKVPCVI